MIKKEKFVPNFEKSRVTPFIHLVDNQDVSNNRNFEAFFLPTKYNSQLKVKKNKKSPLGLQNLESKKAIFSALDRSRIFHTFTARFTESEYWTISELQMHKIYQDKKIDKNFIKKQEKEKQKYKFIEEIYNLNTDFLFQGPDSDEYSR